MSSSNSSRITIEIETGADPIHGLIERADGSSEPFWGWLALLDELHRVAADGTGRAPPDPTELRPGRDAVGAAVTSEQRRTRRIREEQQQ